MMGVKCAKLVILAGWILAVPLAATQVRSPSEGTTTMSDREVRGLPEPIFTELSREDSARLERQRAVVLAAARQRYGTRALTRTKRDLPVLQNLIDDKVFNRSQTHEYQSLGVAFGDVLASELPLRWVMVTDEFGTDPTLRFKETTLQINALTMISKRVERDEPVNVQWLLDKTREQLAASEKKFR
ncbi:MAG: DUF3806 domain-containing protein [Candidatus Sulfotelmatobacter sp.]